MRLAQIIYLLQQQRAAHGDVEVRTGGSEGDDIGDVWYDADVGCVYIH